MLLATAEQIREADRRTIKDLGLPGAVLMENAAQGAVDVLLDWVGPPEGLRVAAFCGRGNNGGDGLAMLRILANRGAECRAYLFCKGEDLAGDAALNHKVAVACGVEVAEVIDDDAFEASRREMAGFDAYLDALLGTGLNSPVRGRYKRAIGLLNSLDAPVMAIDIPSGLSADTGRPLGTCVKADFTATFGMMKLGLALEPGDLAGELSLVDISIPPFVIDELGVAASFITEDLVRELLPGRPAGAHKGSFGHLMIAGGSPGKSGAACLAAWGGIRSGAGLVTVGVPAGLNLVVEATLTAAMSQPLPEDSEGGLALGGAETVMELMRARNALVLGPGLGRSGEARDLALKLMRDLTKPLVLDADGLNALALAQNRPSFEERQVVLTPHPGEASRLLGLSVPEIQDDRATAARRLAAESGAVVVLKGARSLVAEPGGGLWVNPTGNPLLASGGSGDLLSGLVGGFMAQGLAPLDAALAAVFLHGLAADLARESFGQRGMAAEELKDFLPAAFEALEQDEPAAE